MRISIIIPCYNEYNNLTNLIKVINKVISEIQNLNFILINNGSTDKTLELLSKIKSNKIQIVNLEKNLGYGGGIKEGLKVAKSEILCWTHADEQVKIEDVIKLIYKIIKSSFLETNLKSCMATGNLGITTTSKQGVSQVLNRLTSLSTLSHLRRVNTPME